MAKQVIRLNESDLARMIGEAVKELKKEGKSHKRGEDCRGGNCDGHKTKMKPYKEPKYRDFDFDEEDVDIINEVSYQTAKSAYDKMMQKGQSNRAGQLNQTYNDIQNNRFGTKSGDGEYYDYNFDRDAMTMKNYKNGKVTDRATFDRVDIDKNVNDGPNTQFRRTDNRKLANNRANALNQMKNPNDVNKYTKNDFIAEAIRRTIKDYIHKK